MTFTLEKAEKIVEHYKYLIGKPIAKNTPTWTIQAIIITPEDWQETANVLQEYRTWGNNKKALFNSKYDPSKVRVILVHWSFDSIVKYIEDYLKDFNIEEIYNSNDF